MYSRRSSIWCSNDSIHLPIHCNIHKILQCSAANFIFIWIRVQCTFYVAIDRLNHFAASAKHVTMILSSFFFSLFCIAKYIHYHFFFNCLLLLGEMSIQIEQNKTKIKQDFDTNISVGAKRNSPIVLNSVCCEHLLHSSNESSIRLFIA